MPIIVSPQLAILSSPPAAPDPRNPIVGWHNIVRPDNVFADTEQVEFPAANLGNPATSFPMLWRAANAANQNVTIEVNQVEVDYLAVAGHNFGSAQIEIAVEGRDNPVGPFAGLAPSFMLAADDPPFIVRLLPQPLHEIRLSLKNATVAPQAAVIYVGKLLVLQRRIYVGHRPLPHSWRTEVVTGVSDEGVFLGRVVMGEYNESEISLKNITPNFFRSEVLPWLRSATRNPFFFAWRPGYAAGQVPTIATSPNCYPLEVGYCWSSADSRMSNQRSNGMVEFSLPIRGMVGRSDFF